MSGNKAIYRFVCCMLQSYHPRETHCLMEPSRQTMTLQNRASEIQNLSNTNFFITILEGLLVFPYSGVPFA